MVPSMRCLLLISLAVALAAQDPGILRSTRADRTDLSLTVYHPYQSESGSHEGFGLLREVRRVKVPRGRFTLRWEGLPREVTEASAQLESITPDIHLTTLERNYDRNLITRRNLLAAALNDSVRVGSHSGSAQSAVLKSLPEGADGEVVVATPAGLEAAAPDQIHPGSLPSGLSPEPTLSAELDSDRAGEVDLRLTLLVEGLKWTAHYTLDLAPTLTRGRLEGYAVIENRSGMAFEGVRLALVAGPVNRVRWQDAATYILDGLKTTDHRSAFSTVEVVAAAMVESLGEVHLFSWPHPFTLGALQTKQIALLSRPEVRVEPTLRCASGLFSTSEADDPAGERGSIELKVINERQASNAGPWPEGRWQVRIPTPEGFHLRSEDQGTATPLGESLSFSTPPVRVRSRSRHLGTRQPFWGRYSRVETWEVEVVREEGLIIPMPAQLAVFANGGDLEITGPPEGRMEDFAFRMPLDLARHPRQTFLFTVRHLRSKNP